MRAAIGQQVEALDSATSNGVRRAARFSDCETADDDEDEDDDDDDDDDDDYSTSSSENCSEDELDMRRRSRRSRGITPVDSIQVMHL